MKSIIAVLSESPFYFTMTLQDRHKLVKRLACKKQGREPEIDLTKYDLKVCNYLKVEDLNLLKELCRYSPFDHEAID